MAEKRARPLKASTQYTDLHGTLAIDQAQGHDLLRELMARVRANVKVPKGYSPVGFSIWAHTPADIFYLTVFAIDADTMDADAAAHGEERADYVRAHATMSVFEFKIEIKGEELAKLILPAIKRLELVAATRELQDKPMRLLQDD